MSNESPLRVKEELEAILQGERKNEYFWLRTERYRPYTSWNSLFLRLKDNTFWNLQWRWVEGVGYDRDHLKLTEVEPHYETVVRYRLKDKN